MKKLAIVMSVATLAGAANAAVLYNQQNLINGTNSSGAASLWGLPQTTSAASISAGGNFAAADDFTVAGGGWIVNQLSFYSYQAQQNGVNHSFTFTSATWQIVSGGVNGTVVASGSNVAVTNGGFLGYRAPNTLPDSTDQPIYRVNVAVNNLNLADGTYWVRWSLRGSLNSGPWQPYNLPAPSTANGSGNAAWKTATASTFSTWTNGGLNGYDWPFTVEGTAVPEPGTMIALAAGISALAARRRRK